MIKNSVRRKEKRQAAKWLLGFVGEDWGIRVLPAGADKPRPVHANTNKRFEAVIASRTTAKDVRRGKGGFEAMAEVPWEPEDAERRRTPRIWLDRLSQSLVIRHFENVPRRFRIGIEDIFKPETVYFTGKRYRRNETCLTLMLIDIDAHKRGGLPEAMQFADHLRDGFLPGCYVETSTNGNGAHVFLVVDKTEWADPDYNAVLKEVDGWLKGVLAATGIELDTVEIKGQVATVPWKDGMPKHVMGTLAKLPRDWERFDELRNSPIYTAHRLLAMTKEHPVKAEHGQGREDAPGRQRPVPGSGTGEGSTSGLTMPNVFSVEVHVGKSADNRLVVTSEDVGIACALLEFIGKRMNEDGTLPWARTKGLWDCLYERGTVRRAFNAKRFAWICRFLNGAGLTDVQDPTYVIGERAAKWSPSEKFWSVALSLDRKEGEEEQYLAETSPHECWERASRSSWLASRAGRRRKGGAWTSWWRRSSARSDGKWRLEAHEEGGCCASPCPKKVTRPPAGGGSPGKACRDPPGRAGDPRPCSGDRDPAPACGGIASSRATCFMEPGQGSYRPLERLVAVHGVAEPCEIRRVLPEDSGDGLAPVLAEGHQGLQGVVGHGRYPPSLSSSVCRRILGEIPVGSLTDKASRYLKTQTPALRGGVTSVSPRSLARRISLRLETLRLLQSQLRLYAPVAAPSVPRRRHLKAQTPAFRGDAAASRPVSQFAHIVRPET